MDHDAQAPEGDSGNPDVLAQIEAALLAVRHEHGRRHAGPPFGAFGVGGPGAGGAFPFGGPAHGGGPWMHGGQRGGSGHGGHAGHAGHHDHDHGDNAETGVGADTPADGDTRRNGPGGRRGRPDGPLGRIARFRMLEALETAERDGGHLSISALAEAVGVDQPRASRLVQEGVERALVRRIPDPSDARRSLIELTAAGRSQITDVRDRRRSTVQRAIADFTPEEAQAFADLFTRFVRGLSRDDG